MIAFRATHECGHFSTSLGGKIAHFVIVAENPCEPHQRATLQCQQNALMSSLNRQRVCKRGLEDRLQGAQNIEVIHARHSDSRLC